MKYLFYLLCLVALTLMAASVDENSIGKRSKQQVVIEWQTYGFSDLEVQSHIKPYFEQGYRVVAMTTAKINVVDVVVVMER